MRTRLYQAVAVAAVLAAGATASSPVFSADMYGDGTYYDAAPIPPQDVFEGWWLGGTVGGATTSYDNATSGSVSSSGVLGGVVGGYSWQHGPYVIGVEGDILATDITGSRRFNGGLNKVDVSLDNMTDLRMRAGYAVTPNLLVFGTAGISWAGADLAVNGPGGAFRETTFFGWNVGGGAEFAFNPNWSARFDYQFTDFDSETLNYPAGKQTFNPDANTFRGSVIYHF